MQRNYYLYISARKGRCTEENSESKENNAIPREQLYVALCPRGDTADLLTIPQLFVSRFAVIMLVIISRNEN